MRPADLADFERERRHATLAAIALEGRATVTDEVIDLHDRIMIRLFATALNKHRARFQDQGRAITTTRCACTPLSDGPSSTRVKPAEMPTPRSRA